MNMKSTIVIAVALLVSILGAGALVAVSLSGMPVQQAGQTFLPVSQDSPAANELTVTGNGVVSVTPDKAALTLSFELTGSSAADVNTTLTATLSELIQEMKDAGVAAADMQTSGMSISSNYNYGNPGDNGGMFRGYTSLSLIVRDIEKFASLIDIAAKKSGYSSCYFSYDVHDKTEPYQRALEQAIAEAELKAQELAEGIGRSLGEVVSVTESEGYGISPLVNRAMDSMSASGIVEPGSVDVRVSVTVSYAID